MDDDIRFIAKFSLEVVVTRMNTPKSEIRWEIGTYFYKLCYPH